MSNPIIDFDAFDDTPKTDSSGPTYSFSVSAGDDLPVPEHDVLELDEEGNLVKIPSIEETDELHQPGLERFDEQGGSPANPRIVRGDDYINPYGQLSYVLPKPSPFLFGVTKISDTEFVFNLSDYCAQEFEHLVHCLYQAGEEDIIRILYGYNLLSEYDLYLLADAIDVSKAKVEVIASSGAINTCIDLRIMLYADVVQCSTGITLLPPSSMVGGSAIKIRSTLEQREKYTREVASELIKAQILTEEETKQLFEEDKIIWVSNERFIK